MGIRIGGVHIITRSDDDPTESIDITDEQHRVLVAACDAYMNARVDAGAFAPHVGWDEMAADVSRVVGMPLTGKQIRALYSGRGMTVAELIEQLKALPQDLPVYGEDTESYMGDYEVHKPMVREPETFMNGLRMLPRRVVVG